MINEIQPYSQVNQNRETGKTTASQEQGDVFKQILKEAAEGPHGTEKSQSIIQPGELSEIASTHPVEIDGNEVPLQRQTDALLSQLEQYADQLGDPGTSLKEVNTFLENIVSSAQNLIQEAENSGDGSPENQAELVDIASRLAITAQSEYIKLQRGDYL